MYIIDKNFLRLIGDLVRLLVNGFVGVVGEDLVVFYRFCVIFFFLKDI